MGSTFSFKGTPADTNLKEDVNCTIEGTGSFIIPKSAITNTGIFKSGYFSLWDILLYLKAQTLITLDYTYITSADAHRITNLNGNPNIWYEVWYEGGWFELSDDRMEYYRIKDKMHIVYRIVSQSFVNERFAIFNEEVSRLANNSGQIIIPLITLEYEDKHTETFSDVLVTAHNRRTDIHQNGVITVFDAVLALAENDLMDIEIKWFDMLFECDIEGTTNVEIKGYRVEVINNIANTGMCGWVYKVSNNLNHVSMDERVLYSPVDIFIWWVNIGKCDPFLCENDDDDDSSNFDQIIKIIKIVGFAGVLPVSIIFAILIVLCAIIIGIKMLNQKDDDYGVDEDNSGTDKEMVKEGDK